VIITDKMGGLRKFAAYSRNVRFGEMFFQPSHLPEASVRQVERRYDLSANSVFAWLQ
jgi:hypothetical protein